MVHYVYSTCILQYWTLEMVFSFLFISQIQSVISRSFSRCQSNPGSLGRNLYLMSPLRETSAEASEELLMAAKGGGVLLVRFSSTKWSGTLMHISIMGVACNDLFLERTNLPSSDQHCPTHQQVPMASSLN